jgi:hypothetical protein
MKNEQAVNHLRTMRDGYAEIHTVSQGIGASSTAEDINGVIRRRAELLAHIAEQEARLESELAGWKQRLAGSGAPGAIMQEIRNLIGAITARDLALQDMLRLRIHHIGNQLFNLPSMARAAIAYAGHSAVLSRRQSV